MAGQQRSEDLVLASWHALVMVYSTQGVVAILVLHGNGVEEPSDE